MEREESIIEKIRLQRMVPLFYHDDASTCRSIVKALYDAGIRCIEFTNRGEHAMDNFRELVKDRDASMQDLLLGTGTVTTADDAIAFITAGSDFLVSPVFVKPVADLAAFHKILYIPGCMTPTEIFYSIEAGCRLIKLFPGEILGQSFIGSVKPLFPPVEFIVTGGIEADAENILSWLNSGAAAVGIGSQLITGQVMAAKDYQGLKERTFKLLEKIRG